MLKPYSELVNIDVLPLCDMRKAKDDNGKPIDVPYLNWAKCKQLLHENGAEKVYFEPVAGPNGSSLIMSDQVFTDSKGNTNRCYEVKVHVVIDDLEFDAQFPLMNGSNPVKDNSLTQQRLWNAQTRAFVKGVAIHTGLGFNLWTSDDEGGDNKAEDDLSFHNVLKIKERITQTITEKCQKYDCDFNEIAEKVGFASFDEMRAVVNYCNILERFEKKLKTL